MATGRILLPCPGGISPGGGVAAGWQKVRSSGTVTNGPAASTARCFFDQSTDWHWLWSIVLPGDYVSGGTLRIKWGADVTSGNAILKAALGAVVDSSTDTDTFSLNTVSTSSAIAVPGTSGHVKETTLAPSATSLAANQLTVVMLGRDADNGSDTAAGNVWIAGALFEYTI